MQDNVYMPIKEGEEQVATLAVSPTEYVVDSHTMAALGNGNPDKGADYMDAVVKDIRKEAYGTDKQPNEINGLQTLIVNDGLMNFIKIQPQSIELIWPLVKDLVQKPIDFNLGEFNLEDVYNWLTNGYMHLWIIGNEEEILVAVVTEFVALPKRN